MVYDTYSYHFMIIIRINTLWIPSDPCDLRPRIIAQPQKNVKTREENYKGSHKSQRPPLDNLDETCIRNHSIIMRSRRGVGDYITNLDERISVCHRIIIIIPYVSYIITVKNIDKFVSPL